MKDISELVGFPVTLNDDGTLTFGHGVLSPRPEARKLKDASPVLLYPDQGGPETLYLMYRGTGLEKDQNAMINSGLRFDLTVIYPGKIGSEYVKTFGHYHPLAPGQAFTYPEVYQVIHGKAHFLMQKGGDITGEVEDFVVADFEEGDILLIPPFYGHATVNPGNDFLVIANWIAREFASVYEPIRVRKGMAYYDVEYKDKSIFMPNDSYSNHPKPRLEKPKSFPELGLRQGVSMYRAWQEGAKLDFLVKPVLYQELWKSIGIEPGERH
ncbi:MAG TPA: glucose-6-phosphate isomerase [Firmicutes bacterium]|nr:glucose-6-phosphate isomerase [Candidatus Fermentithermobacillaceae bacterium]